MCLVGLNPPRLGTLIARGHEDAPARVAAKKVDFPLILGTDVSGVVRERVAGNVATFAPGNEVYSMVRFPSVDGRAYAEYVSVPASELAIKPGRIDHVYAAGALMSLLTAWQFLIEQGHDIPNPIQPAQHQPVELNGKTVLINGAAGGVGHFALQLAKWKGARVIAVADGTRHEAFLRRLRCGRVHRLHQEQAWKTPSPRSIW